MLPQIDPVTLANLQLAEKLTAVASECVAIEQAAGRVLSEDIQADRDSPPLNVSAMDGYALRIADALAHPVLPVAAVATAGHPAPSLPSGAAVQIFTGAPVPEQADCVVPREQTVETKNQMQLNIPAQELQPRMHIRYRGENAQAGSCVLPKGTYLSSAAMAGLASVAQAQVNIHRRVRVAILNTGDELIPPGQPALPWQIRDSNGPTLSTALERWPWIEVCLKQRVPDSLSAIANALRELESVDAVLLTGGVSMGDTDHVPAAIESLGGQIIFHRLPIRPGKPVLGAVLGKQLIIGLPGNPVSVAVTARIVALPLLRRLAGMTELVPRAVRVEVANADEKQLKLHWYRLVRLAEDGRAHYLENRGSGDLISLAQSDGVIELPAGCQGPGPWKFLPW
jgi:molybdopterin molybdotransferase